MKNERNNFIENELIILTKQTLDEFLKKDNPSELIALYTFYYYTAKWQETNQPKCTDAYVQKGLHWGYTTFLKAKKTLLELGLIEQKINRLENGKIKGFYIKLNYLMKQKTIDPVLLNASNGQASTNALSDININALSSNIIGEKNSPPNFNNSEEIKKEKEYPNEFKKLIEIWNSIDRIASKHKNLNTKTIENSYKYYKWLKKGVFLKNTCIEKEILKKYNIPIEDKKYTDEEIQKGINYITMQFEDGYYPFELNEKRRILPKSLEKAFYSDYGCVSSFLKCFYNPPQCREELTKESTNEFPHITEKIKKEIFENKTNWTIRENNLLIRGVSDWWERIQDYNLEKIKSTCSEKVFTRVEMDVDLQKNLGSIDNFIDNLILFLSDKKENWEKLEITPNFFNSSYWWNSFITWIQTELGIDLNDYDLKSMRETHEKLLSKKGILTLPVKTKKEELNDIKKALKSVSKGSPLETILLEKKKEILKK